MEGFSFLSERCLNVMKPDGELLKGSPQCFLRIDVEKTGDVGQYKEEVSEFFPYPPSVPKGKGFSEFPNLLVQFF